jgi:hypothetical protein
VCLFVHATKNVVLHMNRSPLTEYRMKDIGVVLRIYEWVLFYAEVLYQWRRLKDAKNASLITVHNFTLSSPSC